MIYLLIWFAKCFVLEFRMETNTTNREEDIVHYECALDAYLIICPLVSKIIQEEVKVVLGTIRTNEE
jgi:hypothetical protein